MTDSPQTYRIGIDCRLSGRKHAGIGRYIENLLHQLPTHSTKQLSWVFFFYDKEQWKEFLSKQTTHLSFYEKQKVVFAAVRHYSLDEQLRMPAIFAEQNLDLLHVPHFNIPLAFPGKIVVTIHDLLWHEYRGLHVTTLSPFEYWVKHGMYRLVVKLAVSRAKIIFVPAETTKKTLLKYFPEASKKLEVTYEGVEEPFLKSHRQFNQDRHQLVYVGSLYPHKNIEVVLQGLLKLPKVELHLVGARNVFQENVRARVQELKLSDRVKFHGYLDDAQLIELFHECSALVQPSLFEGFGLTGIEAMATGLPVVASNIPIFHEIYQDHALFFDPHSAENFAKSVMKLEDVTDNQLFHAKKHVEKTFSWKEMAEKTIDTYLSVLKKA